ncbi:MAG: oxidoreductase [Micavibrio sp.]|nr:oxidoreductase [Micavibrio sp.]|tara:strand:+ start:255741 stop:256115 length:375 start_codon:yes stop_codon:yes gene_type:complete
MSLHVRIFKPAKSAMTSGRAKTNEWVLEYETETPRTPDPLMGWQSSQDTLNQVTLNFDTMENAVQYAIAKGWVYTVLPPQEKALRPRNYSDNFKYVPPQAEKRPVKKKKVAQKKKIARPKSVKS